MREEGNYLKSSSWPKFVARKWLNIKSTASHEDLHSDCKTTMSEWMAETSNGIGRSGFEQTATTNLNLRTFVGTWNVGGKSPDNDLNINDWLIRTANINAPVDIYVLGFQEIVPLNAGNVLGPGGAGPARKWLSLVHAALNSESDDEISSSDELIFSNDNFSGLSLRSSSYSSEEGSRSFGPSSCPSPIHEHAKHPSPGQQHKYCLVANKQMVGVFLCVWVRQDLYRHITRTKVSCVGTGLMGYLGNKGSVSISMTLYQTTFCFVCTHLASGEKQGDAIRRNLDVVDILKRTRFSSSCKISGKPIQPEHILDHDNIIWLGDLNYRLASICCDTYKLLERKDWQSLIEKDQLRIEQRADGVFRGWEEGDISFPPTYKYLTNSDEYYAVHQSGAASFKEKPKRTPAWCDRILWRGKSLKQMCYERCESRFSDHRPVYSLFSVQLQHASAQEETAESAAFTTRTSA